MNGARFVLRVVLVMACCGCAAGLGKKKNEPTAEELLQQAVKVYAEMDSFRMRMEKEDAQTAPRRRSWDRTEISAIRTPSGRFRIDTNSGWGSWAQVSDGKTESLYWADAKLYEQHPLAGVKPKWMKVGVVGYFDLRTGWDMAKSMESELSATVNAKRLKDETIALGGQRVRCFVVEGNTKPRGDGFQSQRTFWIDTQTRLIRKMTQHNHSYMVVAPKIEVPFEDDVTEVFPVFELNPVLRDEEFAFAVPVGTKKVDSMEAEIMKDTGPQGLFTKPLGRVAPDTKLAAADGSLHTISEYRGKPLLIDMWATWCGPCLEAMPDYAQLAQTMKGKDVVVLSVDQDEKAETAREYLERHGYSWTNLHDDDGKFREALGERGVPVTLVIDRKGQVVFEQSPGSENAEYDTKLNVALDKVTQEPAAQ